MIRGIGLAVGLAALTLTGACSVPRPKPVAGVAQCDLPRTTLTVYENGGRSASIAANPLARAVDDMAADRVRMLGQAGTLERQELDRGATPDAFRIRHLVLSGGGQHGSFGAGFLAGMDPLPDYNVVTGVSTGALQAPLAILGNARSKRRLDPADDFPPLPADRRTIDDLVAGYTITAEKTLYRSYGEAGIIRRARMGDLEPLRERIGHMIDNGTMGDLAALDRRNKQLYVLLLNWDSGQAEVIDMLELARRGTPRARECFIDVLIAASSEPLGTPPILIDDHLYVDAGLRFGVFARDAVSLGNEAAAKIRIQIKLLQLKERSAGGGEPAPLNGDFFVTDMIRNGDMEVAVTDPPPAKYSALDVINRARSILVNQVYAFSIDEVLEDAAPNHLVRLAYITQAEMKDGPPEKGATFDPVYMRRMIALGKVRGKAGSWNETVPRKPE